MATKNVPAKAKTTAVGKAMTWQERLAGLAQDAVKTEESVSAGNFLSFKSGQLSYQGNAVQGNALDVIVLDHILENCFYGRRYDPDNPTPPVCYAFGTTEDDLAPHEKSAEPQHETCSGCPMNEFETADQGKGKACKNTRRLGLIPADNLDPEALESVEVAFAKLPVTSVKGWASYVRTLATLEKKPPLGFVTRLSVVPDAKSQFKVMFNKVEALDEDVLGVVLQRHDEVHDNIAFPYPEASEEAPPAKAAKKPAAKRKY